MTLITIVPGDNRVYVDDEWRTVDFSSVNPDVQQLWWDTIKGNGVISYKTVGRRDKIITDFSPYQKWKDAYDNNEPPPPPIIIPPTDEEQIDGRALSPFDRGIIKYLSSKHGDTPAQIIQWMKDNS